jgi:hypothetical protein
VKRLASFISDTGLTLQAFKTALAASLAWLAGTTLFPSQYPYFAPLAAILTVQVTVAHSLKSAIQRFSGIVIGVIISSLVGYWLPLGALSIFIMTILGLAVANVFQLSSQITSQIGMTSLLVLAISKGQGSGYAVGRIVETLVGSFTAILTNALIIPPNTIPAAEKQILRISTLASDTLKKLGTLLNIQTPLADYNEVELLISETGKGIRAIHLAKDSLMYSPLTANSQRKLDLLALCMQRLEYITIQIRGIRKGLLDFDLHALTVSDLHNLQTTIHYTAACISYYGKQVVDPSSENETCLFSCITKAHAKHQNCLNDMMDITNAEQLRDLGGILTDLDRIIEGIENELKLIQP